MEMKYLLFNTINKGFLIVSLKFDIHSLSVLYLRIIDIECNILLMRY